MHRKLAIAAGLLLFGAAAGAQADYYVYRDAPAWTNENSECWNPHARHFERVRPGDNQPDLDFGRCRPIGGDNYYYDDRSASADTAREECWNPRAGHFEAVRPGEHQGDLDYSRCRVLADGNFAYGRPYWPR